MATQASLTQQPFLVVDLETTGGSALYDRAIEIAALRVEGGRVQACFEALLDPGIPIPPFISRLTGITSSQVRGKPGLEDVLAELARLAEGAVLVAHNASFDAAFLEAAFRRVGRPWEPRRLCTLRLARRLVTGLHSYKLDSLCAHLGFHFVQRHRARPDAEAVASLLAHLIGEAQARGVASLSELLRLQGEPLKHARRKKGRVDEGVVASLPAGPGVYLLKDERGHVVYVGKSINVRSRVRHHLRPSGTACGEAQPRLRKRLPYVVDVEAIETGSEIEALFLESKLVKRYLPDANRKLRDYRDYPFVKLEPGDGFPRLVATRERPTDEPDARFFGPFRNAGRVTRAVEFLSEQLGLRQCSGPLKAGQSACALLDLGKCLGPCVGAASADRYGEAVDEAVRVLRGDDGELLERAARRRDELAESLRFEEAAELRDRIREVELLVGSQQRLQSVAERNLVIVTPERDGPGARLLLIRGGRLAREVRIASASRPPALDRTLRAVYRETPEGCVSRDDVDDMLILDTWLRHRREGAHEVPVSLEEPESAAPVIRKVLRELTSHAGPLPQPTA